MAGGHGLSVVYSTVFGASQKSATHAGNPLYIGEKEGEKRNQSGVADHLRKRMQNICIH